MPTKFPFTVDRLRGLKPPAAGREYHRDTRTRGLQVCVTASGTKTYYYVRRIHGNPTRVRIGRLGEVSLPQARRTAEKLGGQIADGDDPQATRRSAREEPTLGDLFAHWITSHAKVHKREKSWKEDQRQYNTFLRRWQGRRLSSIRRPDVQRLHARVGEKNGSYAANRMLALLRAMYNRASDIGYRGGNPAAGVKRFPEESRDRYLQADELGRFFRALDEDPNGDFRDYFYLALLTGARKGDLLAMRWQDVRLQEKAGLWRVRQSKTGQVVIVPLVEPAAEILRRRFQSTGGSVYVFPGRGRTGHLAEPKSAWRRICQRAGLQGVWIHDLRRTLGSWQVATGASLPIIGKMLGHTQPSTTQVYARLDLDPVREAAELATAAMLKAGGVKSLEDS